MLSLDIELLRGVYQAALPGGGREWPPHPERVYSALVQAWADGGKQDGERAALAWFEQLPPPLIEADPPDLVEQRDSPVSYVPPNDRHGLYGTRFPERKRQPRSFTACIPTSLIVRLIWTDATADDALRHALDAMARRTASLGHSSSLVRLTFDQADAADDARLWRPARSGEPIRVPHRGRLAELERWHDADQRPGRGAITRYALPGAPPSAPACASVFGGAEDWFVFEETSHEPAPDILAFAHVAAAMRGLLMSRAAEPIPDILSGHGPQGAPTRNPHIAIVPLQNVGFPHASGGLLGFAVVLPRDAASEAREAALDAIAGTLSDDLDDEQDGAGQIHLVNGRHLSWRLSRSPSPVRVSLRPERWCRESRDWASATPVLLDRFADANDPVAEAEIIANSCVNIGLPQPVSIEIHKHSAIPGAESCYPARGKTSRPDWSFPQGSKFAARPRRHVVLRFASPVRGPVILGAGRFSGFGLCLPFGASDR